MDTIKYVGCFLDFETLHQKIKSYKSERLYRSIVNPHITFSYRPQTVPTELFGISIKVKVVGYGCDGENEALLVEFVDLPETLANLANQITTPHITLSVSEHGRSVNSNNLVFEPITPFYLEGIFGAMDESGVVHT